MGKVSKALTGYMAEIKANPSCRIVLYSTGGVPGDTQELGKMAQALSGATVYKQIKFNAKDKSGSDALAYNLGVELSK